MPGPTDTEFFERADMGDTAVGTAKKDSPAQVAKQGFQALMSGRSKLVAGSLKTKASGITNRVTPDKAKAAMHRLMAKPGSGKK
jgi:short-subunit dehydrogenase